MKWAEYQPGKPSLSEVIRRLVEIGLAAKAPAKSGSKPGRLLRARELAAEAIDKISDPVAHPEVSRGARQSRRRNEWARDPRVLVCIIAALVFTIWIALQQIYY